jgi:hypothetical protein
VEERVLGEVVMVVQVELVVIEPSGALRQAILYSDIAIIPVVKR